MPLNHELEFEETGATPVTYIEERLKLTADGLLSLAEELDAAVRAYVEGGDHNKLEWAAETVAFRLRAQTVIVREIAAWIGETPGAPPRS